MDEFCIVADDLRLGHRPLCQRKGIKAFDTIAIIRKLAELHGRYWEHECLGEAWLSSGLDGNSGSGSLEGEYEPWFVAHAMPFFRSTTSSAELRGRFAKLCETPGVKCAEIDGILEVMTGECRLKIREVFRKTLSSRPRTLLHGELCPESIWQSSSDRRRFVFSDFQMLHAGPPAIDLVRLLSANLADEEEYESLFAQLDEL